MTNQDRLNNAFDCLLQARRQNDPALIQMYAQDLAHAARIIMLDEQQVKAENQDWRQFAEIKPLPDIMSAEELARRLK